MAHPYASHRQDKVAKSRVAHITRGYASGGAVKAGDAKGSASAKKAKAAIVDDGAKAAKKADRPARAKGGRVKHKNKGTNVNVIVGAQHPPAPPMGAPGLGPMPPAMPPHPPVMPPPGAAGPMPPTSPPIAALPPHAAGGRAFAKGGRVKGTKVYEEGVANGTPVQHDPGKNDKKDMNRGKPVTYKTGGAVEANYSVSPATKLPGGAGGGEGRLAKAKAAKRK